ncbi:hypothetical protein GCM10028862_17370 [Luteimonas pelagia]
MVLNKSRGRGAARPWIAAIAVVSALGAAAAGFAYGGFYNVAADVPHTGVVTSVLDVVRERSIRAHARGIAVPGDLADAERMRQGAGNYAAMCTGCHLAPGMAPTELSRGLYPAPPNLSRHAVDPAEAFWVIKHGIKASGMPAWGGSMDDAYIWNMVAFLGELPGMDETRYAALVSSSDGHAHGDGESGAHPHHDAPAAEDGDRVPGQASEGVTHVHADGTVETHPAPMPGQAPAQEGEAPADARDGHDHEH